MTRKPPKKLVDIKTEGVLYIRDLPVDVKDQFKSWCARHHISMTRQIEKMLKELVDGADKNELPKRVAKS